MHYTNGYAVEILQLEQKYSELKLFLTELSSKLTKLLKISDYFSFVLTPDNNKTFEAYIVEFIPNFLSYINSLEIRGLEPTLITKLKDQINLLKELNYDAIILAEINNAAEILD